MLSISYRGNEINMKHIFDKHTKIAKQSEEEEFQSQSQITTA